MATSSLTDRFIIKDMETYERLLAMPEVEIELPDFPEDIFLDEGSEILDELFR